MKTVRGQEVNIIKMNEHHPTYPIIGTVTDEKGNERPMSWTKKGQWIKNEKSNYDLELKQ